MRGRFHVVSGAPRVYLRSMTMPGLPRTPAAGFLELGPGGEVLGMS